MGLLTVAQVHLSYRGYYEITSFQHLHATYLLDQILDLVQSRDFPHDVTSLRDKVVIQAILIGRLGSTFTTRDQHKYRQPHLPSYLIRNHPQPSLTITIHQSWCIGKQISPLKKHVACADTQSSIFQTIVAILFAWYPISPTHSSK